MFPNKLVAGDIVIVVAWAECVRVLRRSRGKGTHSDKNKKELRVEKGDYLDGRMMLGRTSAININSVVSCSLLTFQRRFSNEIRLETFSKFCHRTESQKQACTTVAIEKS